MVEWSSAWTQVLVFSECGFDMAGHGACVLEQDT